MGCTCLQKHFEIENEFDSRRLTELNEKYDNLENKALIKKIQRAYREHLNHLYSTNKDLSTNYGPETKIKKEEILHLLK